MAWILSIILSGCFAVLLLLIPSHGHITQMPSSSGTPVPVTVAWAFVTIGQVVVSPSLDVHGHVYIGSGDTYLYSIDTEDGHQLWNLTTNASFSSSPKLRQDGVIVVGSDDWNIYAVNSRDGSVLWTFPTTLYIYSSAAFDSDLTTYVGSDDSVLYAINANGTEKWRYHTDGQVRSTPAVETTISPVSVSPRVDAVGSIGSPALVTGLEDKDGDNGTETVIFVGSDDQKFYCFHANGSVKWSYATDGLIRSSPRVGRHAVYVGSYDTHVYAFNKTTGDVLWRFKTNERVRSSPALSPNEDVLYIGSFDNSLYALNTTDGSMVWNFTTNGWVYSSPTVSSCGCCVYVGSYDQNVYEIRAHDGAKLWNYTVNGIIASSPAIGEDGRVYIGGDVSLYALTTDTVSLAGSCQTR